MFDGNGTDKKKKTKTEKKTKTVIETNTEIKTKTNIGSDLVTKLTIADKI